MEANIHAQKSGDEDPDDGDRDPAREESFGEDVAGEKEGQRNDLFAIVEDFF